MGKPTGGTITIDGDYTVHKFTASGTFVAPKGGVIDVLVVAGGGAGGDRHAGGGGGGGVIYETDFAITAGSYEVTVGAGGVEGATLADCNGGDSVFSTLTAKGGGQGGCYTHATTGQNGGSGGGGRPHSGGEAYGNGTVAQGYRGTVGHIDYTYYASYLGGGGGGAGATGAVSNWDTGDKGGNGIACDIVEDGTDVYYGGGGGGTGYDATYNTYGGEGGLGGGGKGAGIGLNPLDGSAGGANLGGGGGGGGYAGGSGVVIIRYLTADFMGGGLFTFHG